jgi:AAA15 family ATPase/GTPase
MSAFIKSIKPNKDSNGKVDFFQFELEWEEIQKFSLIIGKNGIGKSNLLKQIPLFFNRIKKKYRMEGDEFKTMYPEYSPNDEISSEKIYKIS